MTALYFKQNNQALKNNKKAINMIKKIMIEGEEVMNFLKITHSQNYNQRINQTLSSSIHTMSMLNDFKKGKKIELKYLWDSYKFLLKLSRIKMNYTNQIYKEVIKKINS
jgi:ketopantoate reductase